MRSFRIFFCALLAGVASAFLPAKAQRTVWAAMLPDAYANLSASAAVTDSAGNTYVVGRFMGRLQTDGLTIQSAYPRDVDTYYAKYNAQGRVQWLIRAGAADTSRATTETPRAIALDGQGHLFVSGYMG